MSAERPTVIFAGGLLMDLITFARKSPGRNETVLAESSILEFGGKCPKQALVCKRLGGVAAVLGKIGLDRHGEEYLDFLDGQGVNTEYIGIEIGVPTGTASIFVNTSSGEKSVIMAGGANNRMGPADVERAQKLFTNAKVAVGACEMPIEANIAFLKLAKKRKLRTLFNAAPGLSPFETNPRMLRELFGYVDTLCLNETEAGTLNGNVKIDNVREARAVLEHMLRDDTYKNVRDIILTVGPDGAVVGSRDDKGKPFADHIPAPKTKVLDVTGAGDVFMGSLAFFLAGIHENDEQDGIKDIVRRACHIGAISAQKRGVLDSFPDKKDVPQELLRGVERGTVHDSTHQEEVELGLELTRGKNDPS